MATIKSHAPDAERTAGSLHRNGSVARTIADEIADYKATPESAKRTLRKVVEKLIDLRCPHCGESVSVTIET